MLGDRGESAIDSCTDREICFVRKRRHENRWLAAARSGFTKHVYLGLRDRKGDLDRNTELRTEGLTGLDAYSLVQLFAD
jgi:hypothetical protein